MEYHEIDRFLTEILFFCDKQECLSGYPEIQIYWAKRPVYRLETCKDLFQSKPQNKENDVLHTFSHGEIGVKGEKQNYKLKQKKMEFGIKYDEIWGEKNNSIHSIDLVQWG